MSRRKRRSRIRSQNIGRAEACLIDWLQKFARHHKTTIEQEEIDIYVNALRGKTEYQINTACMRCLTEVTFMPRIAEIVARLPIEAHSAHYTGYTQPKPIPDIVRDIAKEISPVLLGSTWEEIYEQDHIRNWLVYNANLVRYLRMGAINNQITDPTTWLGTDISYLGMAVNIVKLREIAAMRTQTWFELTGLEHEPPEAVVTAPTKPPRFPHLIGKGINFGTNTTSVTKR